ncbi:MAG: glycosyltransferase [Endomicrobia bacterium]|nr:glycosyltransferase [Endomicrobiia bacterium]
MIKISIIIPTYNSVNTIGRCLNSIYSQEGVECCEVIVVDDCSTDNTIDEVKKYPCEILKLDIHSGVSVARNTAAKKAKGEILLFLDSDIIIQDDGIMKVIKLFEKDNEIKCVQGVYAKHTISSNPAALSRNYYKYHKISKISDKYIYGINSYCFAIKKELFQSIGGFNSLYDGVEDVELGLRLTREGYKIYLEKELNVIHQKEYNFLSLLKTDFRKVYKKLCLMLDMYLNKKKTGGCSKVTFSLNKLRAMSIELLSIPLSVIILFTGISGLLFNRIFLIICFCLLFLFTILNYSFFKLIKVDKGIFITIRCFIIYYFEMVVTFLSIVVGTIIYFIRRFFTKTKVCGEKKCLESVV